MIRSAEQHSKDAAAAAAGYSYVDSVFPLAVVVAARNIRRRRAIELFRSMGWAGFISPRRRR